MCIPTWKWDDADADSITITKNLEKEEKDL